tara:strand:+ start:102 stop:377 length:276 start_codon:yes stop_codon:yes gene_type:complete
MAQKNTSGTRYDAIFDTEIGKEFGDLKDEYKAARKCCRTHADRVMLMKAYQEDLVDLAIDARIEGEFELNSVLNTLIQSLSRRTFRGRRNW